MDNVEKPFETRANNSRFFARKEKVKSVDVKQIIGKSQVKYVTALKRKRLMTGSNGPLPKKIFSSLRN